MPSYARCARAAAISADDALRARDVDEQMRECASARCAACRRHIVDIDTWRRYERGARGVLPRASVASAGGGVQAA